MDNQTRDIIIDTDPGKDDAVAILLALASPELRVLGLTIVAGNVPLDMTLINARKICELAGRPDIRVFPGAGKPLERMLATAEEVHGRDGLGGPRLPEPTMPVQDQHAVDFIIETLRTRPEKSVTLCTLAPLTNIALALKKAPDVAARIKEIVMMGGGFFAGGNITPAAEFNIYVDPQAAQIVFEAGVPIVMIPLDCTHMAVATRERIAAIRALNSPTGEAVGALLDFIEEFDGRRTGGTGTPLHDPNVIAYLLDPALYEGKACHVAIETGSELTMGMSVVDWWGVTHNPPNAYYVRAVDDKGFYTLLTERLAKLGDESKT